MKRSFWNNDVVKQYTKHLNSTVFILWSMFQKERKQKIILLKVPEFVKKNTFRVTIEISSKSFN